MLKQRGGYSPRGLSLVVSILEFCRRKTGRGAEEDGDGQQTLYREHHPIMQRSSGEDSGNDSSISFDLFICGTRTVEYSRRASSRACKSALSSMDRDNERKSLTLHQLSGSAPYTFILRRIRHTGEAS